MAMGPTEMEGVVRQKPGGSLETVYGMMECGVLVFAHGLGE
jgi:hypothetical protein